MKKNKNGLGHRRNSSGASYSFSDSSDDSNDSSDSSEYEEDESENKLVHTTESNEIEMHSLSY